VRLFSRRQVLGGAATVIASRLTDGSIKQADRAEIAHSDIVIVNGWVLLKSDIDAGSTPLPLPDIVAKHDR
jgi:hypothetical protein